MLIPTQYVSVDAFLQQAQSALLQNEAANNLMLGICLRLRNYPERVRQAPFLFTVESEPHRIELAAIMTPPHNLILHCAEGFDPAALDMLADHLVAHSWEIPGVMGPLPHSEQFANLWARRTGRTAHVQMSERAYELRRVQAPRPAPGQLRPASEGDLPLLAEWTRAFHHEALGEEMSVEEAREMTAQRIDDRQLFAWDAGEPVSMAAITRPTFHGITVSLVYTPPQLRGRGFAGNCVAALSQRMLDSGYRFCTLFTNLANPTSNDIYQKIGYRPIADFNVYRYEND